MLKTFIDMWCEPEPTITEEYCDLCVMQLLAPFFMAAVITLAVAMFIHFFIGA